MYYQKLETIYDAINPLKMDKYVQGEISGTECTGQWEKLSGFWIEQIGDKYFYLSTGSNSECMFNSISMAISQYIGKMRTSDDIRNEIAGKIQDIPSDLENGIDGWRLMYNRFIYKFGKINKIEYDGIDTLDEMKKFILSPNYLLSAIDLLFISYIYNIKIIVLKYKGDLGIKEMDKYIMCLNATCSLTNKFLLLYKQDYENYSLIAKDIYTSPKYIFDISELPEIILNSWKSKCGSTDNETNINAIEKIGHFLKNAPVLMDFDVIDYDEDGNPTIITGKTKFVNIESGQPLVNQQADVHLTKEQHGLALRALSKDKELGNITNPLVEIEEKILNTYNIPEEFAPDNLMVDKEVLKVGDVVEANFVVSPVPEDQRLFLDDEARTEELDLGVIKFKYLPFSEEDIKQALIKIPTLPKLSEDKIKEIRESQEKLMKNFGNVNIPENVADIFANGEGSETLKVGATAVPIFDSVSNTGSKKTKLSDFEKVKIDNEIMTVNRDLLTNVIDSSKDLYSKKLELKTAKPNLSQTQTKLSSKIPLKTQSSSISKISKASETEVESKQLLAPTPSISKVAIETPVEVEVESEVKPKKIMLKTKPKKEKESEVPSVSYVDVSPPEKFEVPSSKLKLKTKKKTNL